MKYNESLYLLACRIASVAEIKRDVLSKGGRYTPLRDNLQANEVIVGNGERRKRYILCYNSKEAECQRKHRDMIVALLEEEPAIGTHRQQRNGPSSCWPPSASNVTCTITKSNQIRTDLAAIREAAKYDGKWVIETNDDTISLEDAACGYKGLMVIERIAERACARPWHQIRRVLDALQVAKSFNLNQRGHIRNEVAPDTRKILKKLDIKVPTQLVHLENTPQK